MVWYVIPARRDSKGFPNKNRLLFKYTADLVSNDYNDVIVTTNDDYIINMASEYEFKIRERPEELAQDNTSIKAAMWDVVNWFEMQNDDIIVMLYLTYPQRTKLNIIDALNFFYRNKANSLLCKKEWKWTHPCLAMFEMYNNKGKQLFYHNYHRRQDYPTVFEISHFIAIFRVEELYKLNNQLYNQDTIFMYIDDVIDIDSYEDYMNFVNSMRLIND